MFFIHTERSIIGDFAMLNESQQVKFILVEGTPEKEHMLPMQL